jgi:membrane protein implicated in regulation of membrane protease activity
MLIAALILAVIGLAALITAVATSNELIAWVCIGASSLGIVLLIVDAVREQFRRPVAPAAVAPAVIAEPETTEVIEQVAEAVVVEDEVVEDKVEGEAWDEVADESSYGSGDFADESDIVSCDVADSAVAVEDHPDEVVHDEPAYDLPTDDEVEFPEPAEVAALHIVSDDASVEYPAVEYVAEESATEEYVAVEYAAVEYASVEYAAVEYASVENPAEEYVTAAEGETAVADAHDTAVTEEYVVETVENHLGSDDADSTTEIRYVPSAEGSADTVYTYSKGSETEYIEAQESGVTHGGQ